LDELVYPLDEMDGFEFEQAVARVFERLGGTVQKTRKSGDEGRDLIVEVDGDLCVVECKHHKSTIGRPVLQKLHSAATTFPGATKAIVVTSSTFSRTCDDYVRQVEKSSTVELELWDFSHLLRISRPLGIFFTRESAGNTIAFTPGWSDTEEVEELVWTRNLESLDLSPREWSRDVVTIDATRQVIPAVAVSYTLDKHFNSSTYHLHHARDEGRLLLPIGDLELSDSESTFWSRSSLHQVEKRMIDGHPVETLFGEDLRYLQDCVARKVASKNSTTTSYQGRNGHFYSVECVVDPKDVEINAKQILLVRHTVCIQYGLQRFHARFADSKTGPALTSTDGLPLGDSGFATGRGIICSDCGVICPDSGGNSGRRCAQCGKTLCRQHSWTWPSRLPKAWPALCHSCYLTKDPRSDFLGLQSRYSPWLLAALSLIPGLSFLLHRRWLPGVAMFMAMLVASLSIILGPTRLETLGTEIPFLSAIAVLGTSFLVTSVWALRVALFRNRMRLLSRYSPSWDYDRL